MTSQQQQNTESVARLSPVALITGALWALLGLFRGSSLIEYLALVCGGALTQWLLMVCLERINAVPRLAGRLLLAGLGSSLLLVPAAWVLLSATHHRPLGAVIFTLLAVAVWVIAYGVSRPVAERLADFANRPALLIGFGGLLLSLILLSVALGFANSNPLLIESLVGALLLAVGYRARAFGPLRADAGWTRVLLGAIVFAAVALFAVPGWSYGAGDRAPVVLGLAGLGQ